MEYASMGLRIQRGDAERRLVLTTGSSAPLGPDYEPKDQNGCHCGTSHWGEMKTRGERGWSESGRVHRLEVSVRSKDICYWGYVIKWMESWKMVSQSSVCMILKVVVLLIARSRMWPLCVVEVKWKKYQWIENHEKSETPEHWIGGSQGCLNHRMRTGMKWERCWARFTDWRAVTTASMGENTKWEAGLPDGASIKKAAVCKRRASLLSWSCK